MVPSAGPLLNGAPVGPSAIFRRCGSLIDNFRNPTPSSEDTAPLSPPEWYDVWESRT